jgi:hypothetical protein
MPDRKLAVFGVAMNDPGDGEGWWMNKIGADHIAGTALRNLHRRQQGVRTVCSLSHRTGLACAGHGPIHGHHQHAPDAIRNTLAVHSEWVQLIST